MTMTKTNQVNFASSLWFKYVKPEPLIIKNAHPEFDLVLGNREVLGVFPEEDSDQMLLVDKSDLSVVFSVNMTDLKEILKFTVPYKGRIQGQEVRQGSADAILSLAEHVLPLEVKSPEASVNPKSMGRLTVSGMPDQHDLDYTLIRNTIQAEKYRRLGAVPMDKDLVALWEKAEDYIGILAKIDSKKFVIAQCYDQTAIVTYRPKGATVKTIAILLCVDQLRKLNGGILDYKVIAQAVTHELGHYIFNEAIKNSHKLAWRRRVGGLTIHKNQYKHGYDYPWYDEHFAMMAEYMVHGKCMRELQSTVGVDIVEQYFDNRYLRDAPGSKYFKG